MLTRDAPRLLRTVNKRPYARDNDHEEPTAKRKASPIDSNAQDDADIFAEPASSDDELRAPPSRSPKAPTAPKNAAHKKVNSSQELRKPQRKPAQSKPQIRTPSKGTYEIGQATKAGKAIVENKENTQSSQASTASKDDDPWGFDPLLKQPDSRKQKKTFVASNKKTNNIHASTAKRPGKTTYGSQRVAYGGKHKPALGARGKSDDESDLSDVSMVDLELEKKEVDPELRSCPTKSRQKQKKPTTSSKILNDDELEGIFHEYDPSDKDLKRTSARAKPTDQFLGQLVDWAADQAPNSSLPSSSGARLDLDAYIDQLPVDDEEGTVCPICRNPVSQETYWAFWKGVDKSIKNQNTFCQQHRKQEAEAEYAEEGYPTIDWDNLASRIRKHRMELYKILTGDRLSAHRERYTPLALTGKAATVPKIRKDLPLHIQQDLEDSNTLDDASTFPGYYGPHGRRIITEAVMKMLKNEIKNCTDPVVQASGPAAFVQAVLVPETAVRLVMEDCLVDAVEADEIRERTFEMGLLLNEEIEDRIEDLGGDEDEDDEDGGNEYVGR